MQFIKRYISRKLLLTIGVMYMVYKLPIEFKAAGIADNITIGVMAIIGAIGAAYGIMNVKDPKH